MENELTFGGYPLTMELIGNTVYVTCKGVTGTDKQIKSFLKNRDNTRYKFGESYIRKDLGGFIKIDCLKDTKQKVKFLYKQSQKLKENG